MENRREQKRDDEEEGEEEEEVNVEIERANCAESALRNVIKKSSSRRCNKVTLSGTFISLVRHLYVLPGTFLPF